MIRGTGSSSAIKFDLSSHGPNLGTQFFDKSQLHRAMTAYGNVAHSSGKSYFGDTSIYFDGSGDLISTPLTSDLTCGLCEFQVEMMINPSVIGVWSEQWVIVQYEDNDNYISFGLVGLGNGTYIPKLRVREGGVAEAEVNAPAESWDTGWHHVITGRGSDGRFFVTVDGVKTTNDIGMTYSIPAFTGTVYIGARNVAGERPYKGYIDYLSILMGFSDPTKTLTRQIG